MSSKKTKKKDEFDPEHMKPEDLLKYEIAEELGLADKVKMSGWKALTSKESGRIGGLITKRKRELKKEALQNQEESHILEDNAHDVL